MASFWPSGRGDFCDGADWSSGNTGIAPLRYRTEVTPAGDGVDCIDFSAVDSGRIDGVDAEAGRCGQCTCGDRRFGFGDRLRADRTGGPNLWLFGSAGTWRIGDGEPPRRFADAIAVYD